MSKMKKLLVILLSLTMVISTLTVTDVFAASNPIIMVEEQTAFTGKTVDVDVSITDNPGILGATLELTFGEGLTLQSATSGDAFSPLVMTKPGKLVSGCKFVWDGQDLAEEDIKDGVILTLTFQVSEEANANEKIDIAVSCDNGDIVDSKLNTVQPTFVDGGIIPMDFMYGDLNSDQKINTTDIILLRRHIAGGYEQEIVEQAADVNQEGAQKGKINSADIVILRRYIAGGYDIYTLPYPITHTHSLKSVAYKEATCTEEGNIAYWYCSSCGKYYSDKTATREITEKETVIAALGHDIIVVQGKAPTATESGLTDGKKCSRCEYWEVGQEVLDPIPDQYVYVQYNLGDTRDSYLAKQTIENPNPASFEASKGLKLQNLGDTIPGYTFLGWYDGFGNNAEQIKNLAANEYEGGTSVQLYAHWEVATYNVTYVCGTNMNDHSKGSDDYMSAKYATYKTNTGLTLPNIGIDKYYFVGWTTGNGEGKVITKIEPGTTGDITLYANWTSYRNRAIQKTNYGDPIIIEDPSEGQVVFAYEIGQLENVPLYTYFNLYAANGIIATHSEEVTVQFTKNEAKNITSAISLATTNSKTWGLSSDWNNVTNVTEKSAEEHGKTVSQAEQESKTTTNGYSLSSSKGGTSSVSTSSSSSSTLSGSESHNSYHEDSNDTAYEHVNKRVENNYQELDANIGLNIEGVGGLGLGGKATHSTENTNGTTNTRNTHDYNNQTDDYAKSFSDEKTSSSAKSSSSTWNNTESYTSSNSISNSKSITNTLTNVIATEKGYGKSLAYGGSNYENQRQDNLTQSDESYSNTFTYGEMQANKVTKTFTSTATTTGDYRFVKAGTVHVFGVVAYDVRTATFSVYTYSVLDDETYDYLDYSRNSTFNDYEYGCLNFEVPILPYQYIATKTLKTQEGLVINDQGIVTDYTGSDSIVYIPTYDRRWNSTSEKYEYIKVKGIADGVFTNNTELKAITLGDYITSINENAFKGCTNLENIFAKGLVSIGKSAFEGCVSLTNFTLADNIEYIGENAFKDVNSISIYASSKNVAVAAAKSEAKNITVNLEYVDPNENSEETLKFVVNNSTEKIKINGAGKTFIDFSIESDATTTQIGNITINAEDFVPVKTSSSNIILEKVNIDAAGYAILSSETADLTVYGTNNISTRGDNAIVCKGFNITATKADALNIYGNVYYCGTKPENTQFNLQSGELIELSEEEFKNYIKGSVKISFNANEGEVSTESITKFFGAKIGELPTPTRDYYTFDGWYSEVDGGKKYTADSKIDASNDFTLYAHWTLNPLSEWTLASNVPSDANVINTKWKYSLTSYTTSTSKTKTGWTLDNSKTTSAWSDYGSWSSWSTTAVSSSDSRKIETKVVTDSAAWTQYHYWIYRSSDGYNCGTYNYYGSAGAKHGYCTIRDDIYLNYALTLVDSANGLYGYYQSSKVANRGEWSQKWFYDGSTYHPAVTHTEYRYAERSLIYTYTFYKVDQLESATDPTGQTNVSNVQKYVQYREK